MGSAVGIVLVARFTPLRQLVRLRHVPQWLKRKSEDRPLASGVRPGVPVHFHWPGGPPTFTIH